MPGLADPKPQPTGTRTLQLAFKNAFLRRLDAESLSAPLCQFKSRHSVSSTDYAKILLGFRSQRVGADDPLLFEYAALLLQLKLSDAPSLLLALLEKSRFSKPVDSHLPGEPSAGLPTCEERIFVMLMQKYLAGTLSLAHPHLHGMVHALARWMSAVTEHEMGKQLQAGPLATADVFTFSLYEALASLVITVFGHATFRSVDKQPWWKKRRPIVVSELQNFDLHVLQWVQSQWSGRLQALSAFPPFMETDERGRPVFTDAQVMQAIEDLPAVHSRAGLYIWLNACLYSRPFADNSSMITYLQARYGVNVQPLVADLLTASFDTLTNAFRSQDSEQSVKVIRSFISNKVPSLLSIISGGMAPAATVDACVQVAFSNMTMDPLPPISAGATEVSQKLKLSRLECLQACMLHGVVTESSVATILQEPAPPLKSHKYTKDGLSAKYSNNIGSMEPLIDELETMHGNAGIIASFIVDTLTSLCVNSDAMSLKVLCNILIKRISTVDIIMQYTSATHLLLPLCNQMNNWTHDQDQEEFTPAYEEFAYMLLFVLAVVYRYGLTPFDLGLQNDDTFISSLLRTMPNSHRVSELTEEQGLQMDKWVIGLYATDEQGETSGISDDVLRPCPPQDFYRLVPTLMEQSVMACKVGRLSTKAFKGGLELLAMPFLLPSLIPALSWIIKRAWENQHDAEILLQVLEKLLRPPTSSPKAMHKIVLGIVADPLYQCLQTLAQTQKGKKEISALMDIVKPFLGRNRLANSNKAECEQWMSTPEGGLGKCLQLTIREQVAWVTNIGPTPPPKYTHRLYKTACDTLGSNKVLDAVLAELKTQTELGNGSYAIDICTAFLCAPGPPSPTTSANIFPPTLTQPAAGSSSVRDALRLRCADMQSLLHTAAPDAECLVRLARAVEAQLSVTQVPQLNLPLPLQPEAADQIMADLGLTDGPLNSVAQDAGNLDPTASAAAAAGFDNADLAAAMSLDMSDPAVHQLAANMAADANAAGSAGDMFDLSNLGLAQQLGSMGGVDGSGSGGAAGAQGDAGGSVGMEFFDELDMSNLDDYNFS